MSQYHKTNGFTPAEEKELQSLLKVIEAIKAREPKPKKQCTAEEIEAIRQYVLNDCKGERPPKTDLFEPLKLQKIQPMSINTLEPCGIVEYELCDPTWGNPTWEAWHKELIEAQQGYSGLIFGLANQVKNAIDEEPNRNAAEIISDTLSEVATRSNKTFSTILQGAATNALTKMRPKKSNTIYDEMTGKATITEGKLTVILTQFKELSDIRPATWRLFDALRVAFTESGKTSPTVNIKLKEFMEACDLSDPKATREQIKKDIFSLLNILIYYEGSSKTNNKGDFKGVRLFESGSYSRGVITMRFSGEYYEYLATEAKTMDFPRALWKLNLQKFPSSYQLGNKITEHKRMNLGKSNEDIIAVKTLLANAPYIPSYDEVMRGNKNVNDRIIKKLEDSLDEIERVGILTWHYCHENDSPLTDDELFNLNYNTFIKLKVKFFWKDYPDKTELIEARKRRKEEAVEHKSKTKTKKKAKPQSGNKSRTTRKN